VRILDLPPFSRIVNHSGLPLRTSSFRYRFNTYQFRHKIVLAECSLLFDEVTVVKGVRGCGPLIKRDKAAVFVRLAISTVSPF
jgi:hypothetical protein